MGGAKEPSTGRKKGTEKLRSQWMDMTPPAALAERELDLHHLLSRNCFGQKSHRFT
jgi:hypothetical protein